MSKTPRRNLAREAREAVDTFSGVLHGEERGNAKKRLYVDTGLEALPNDLNDVLAVDGTERSEEEEQANAEHEGTVSREQAEVQAEVQKSERPSKRSRKHNPEKLKRVQRGSKMFQYIPPSDAQSLPPSSPKLSRPRTSLQSQPPPSTTFFQGWSTEEYARHSSQSPHPAYPAMHPGVSTPCHSFSTPTPSTFSHQTDSFPALQSWTPSPAHPGAQTFGGASRPSCYQDQLALGYHGLGSSAQHRQAPTSSYEIPSPSTPSTPQTHQLHMGGYLPPIHAPPLSANSPQGWVEGTVPWSTLDQLSTPSAGQGEAEWRYQ